MLGKCSAMKCHYLEQLRPFEPISSLKSNPKAEYADITPETEALLVFVMEEHHDEWAARFLKKRNPPNENKEPNAAVEDAPAAKTKAEHTNPRAGRARHAGWTEDGVALFNEELKKKNEAARKGKNNKSSIEEGCLARVRYVHFRMRFLCHVCNFFCLLRTFSVLHDNLFVF